MAATQQPPAPPSQSCASCGSPLAADQRYCLSCGTRRGEPRVPPDGPATAAPAAGGQPSGRQADFSPLAAVIGIALLGGMLLIGVLIGRGSGNDDPAPVVQVGEPSTSTTSTPETTSGDGSQTPAGIASEWPEGTDGFTIQVTTLSKEAADPAFVDAARQQAVSDGAADAAVLDSDLYSSLPPGNYVIYSGVFTDRKSAEVALKGLDKSFPDATVVEVSGDGATSDGADSAEGTVVPAPATGTESEIPPETNPPKSNK